jgi:RHS repeat-associated protein
VYSAPTHFGTFTVTAACVADPQVRAEAAVLVAGGTSTKDWKYDLNGNLVEDGNRQFEWDAENRLTAVTILATNHRSEFGYDGMGRRVCIRELDPDTNQVLQVTSDKKYLWDGVEIAEERTTDGGTVLRRFYEQGFVDTDGTALYYTRDHLGSVRELTDGSQAIRARYDYDPYGRMTKLQGDRDTVFTFTGHFWHAQSGLNLTYFRAYDPSLGRWLSRDPIEEFGGLNLYGYSFNSPTSLIDVLGLTGLLPPPPPGYNPITWHSGGVTEAGRRVLIDPNGNRWYTHPEDPAHWRHWDIMPPNDGGPPDDDDPDQRPPKRRWPSKCKKTWPNQKKPPYGDQSPVDPSGDAPPWSPYSEAPYFGPFLPLLPLNPLPTWGPIWSPILVPA